MNSTFKSRHDRSGLLLSLTTRSLTVGSCGDRYAGTARFFDEKLVYAFEHPRHGKIEMHMSYADMSSISSSAGARASEFVFRIDRQVVYVLRMHV